MRRIRSVLTVLLTVVVAVGLLTPSGTAAADSPPPTTYYLALGDSLAFGYPTGVGYAEYLTARLQRSHPAIELTKLGCPGESTVTMINGGGPCAGSGLYEQYGGSTNQLDAAIWFLRHHRGAVSYLTIDIGPNDVLPCIVGLDINTSCVLGGLNTVRNNLPTIFGDLRQNVDGRTKTAGMTFYDPFTALWPLSQQLARQSVVVLNGLNLIEAGNYLRFGFRIAPVASVFQTNNFTINPYTTQLPVNYAKACAWTLMCPTEPGVAPNIHPNQDGYRVIAATFARTLRVH